MTKRFAFALTVPALVALALFACDGETLTVGDSSTGIGSADSGDVVWRGYVENFQFPSGSDRVTVTFHPDGSGSIAFGDAAPPPPATDPDVASPVVPYDDPDKRPAVVEGFVFTLQKLLTDGERRTFSFIPDEAWAGWCSLQKKTYPWFAQDGTLITYLCTPDGLWETDQTGCTYVDQDAGTRTLFECGKANRCTSSKCECDAAGCSFSAERHASYKFDLVFEDQRASGSSPYGFLRLTRSP